MLRLWSVAFELRTLRFDVFGAFGWRAGMLVALLLIFLLRKPFVSFELRDRTRMMPLSVPWRSTPIA